MIPFNERILLLPHCLRNLDICNSEYNEDGLVCYGDHDCAIGRLKSIAEKLGYQGVYIVPGSSLAKKIVEREKPEFIIGVACVDEIKESEGKVDIPYVAIALSKDGCINTEVEEGLVAEVLKSG